MNLFQRLFLITALLIFCKPAYTDIISFDSTRIIITGTVHIETDNFKSDTLLQLIKKVKPDIILVETDSSYFTPDFELKEDIMNEFPETRALTEYKKIQNVRLIPYDIKGRDMFLNNDERINIRNKILDRISYLSKNTFLSDTSSVWINYKSLIRLAYKLSDTNLTYINSFDASFEIDSINTATYEGIGNLILTIPELNQYTDFWNKEKDFWNRRNENMLVNIKTIIKENSGDRILLICGFAHKNYLLKGLLKYAADKKIIVKVSGDF